MTDGEAQIFQDTTSPNLVVSIASLLDACVRGFAVILKPALYTDPDYISSSVDLREELGRLRLWAGNLGAHRKHTDRLSLDHRLREAPELHKLVGEHLSDILHAIRSTGTILAAGHRSLPTHDNGPSSLESDDSDPDEIWADIKKEDASYPELSEHLRDINHTISSL
ncbi:uncharacterized protein BDV17DRAFT_291018 [Aspergillus undulatus]|uniref:uncharacterized protein n=1 Tax=Aspergillus undulatus TaxID=1810928 RepID=UPI003CCDD824